MIKKPIHGPCKPQPRKHSSKLDYPTLQSAKNRREVLNGLGWLVGITAATGVAGCMPVIISDDPGDSGSSPSTDTGDTGLNTEECRSIVPPQPNTHAFYFSSGMIEYYLVIESNSAQLCSWIEESGPLVLDACDKVLRTHNIYELAPGADLSTIENELDIALVDLLETQTIDEESVEGEAAVALIVMGYDEWEEVDGDIAEPE